MNGDIPSVAALAPMLVANAGARPEDSELVAGLIIDAAQQAAALGAPRPMLEHVQAARAAYPMMFVQSTTTTASASTPPRSITEQVAEAARLGKVFPADQVAAAIDRMRKANRG